jgi:hypothetical protein
MNEGSWLPADRSREPDDPITSLAEGAAQLHELYLVYVEAGFTDGQALYLCAQIVAAGVRRAIGEP